MRKLHPSVLVLSVTILLLLSGCVPEVGVLEEDWNPYFSLPLLTATISMDDILENVEEDDLLAVDSDSLLFVTYSEQLSITTAANLPPIPDFPIPITDFGQTFTLPTEDGIRIDLLDAKQGQLKYEISNPYTETVNVALLFPDIIRNGVNLVWAFTIPAAASPGSPTLQQDSIDLSGYTLRFDNDFRVQYSANLATSGTSVSLHPFTAQISNLDFSYLEGYFGQFTVDIPTDSLDFDFLEDWEQGQLELVAPEIRLRFQHDYGVPIEITTEQLGFQTFLNGYETLSNATLTNGFDLNYPNLNQVGQAQTTNLVLDAENSNIVDIISSIPYRMDYAFTALSNPDNDSTIINFLTDDARMDIDIEAHLPLYGSATGFTFEEISDLNFEDDIEEIERAGIKVIAENGFPLDVALQVYFLDNTEAVIDSLFAGPVLPLLVSATVDDEGIVAAPTVSERLTELDAIQLERLRNDATQVKITTAISTTSNGSTPIRVFNYYDLTVKIGLLAGL